ncbi:MAG: nuclear transport factor 2 family protein [Hellea sp.]
MIKLYFLSIFTLILTACSQATVQPGHPVIAAYSNAYNEKDITTMRALMHKDIEWVGVTGSDIEVHMSGKETLAKEMEIWFENPKLPKGALRDWSINGNMVAVTETAYWTTNDGEEKSQSALTVYELKDDLVRRVYYFEAVPD